MAYKLIHSTDLKKITKGDFGDEFDFALDDIIIPAVGRRFASYCQRPDFDKALRTEYLSPHGYQRKLFLASPPVSPAVVGPPAIEALRLYQDTAAPRAYGASTELVNGTDFFLWEDKGVIEKVGDWFTCGAKTIKVTYTGGYLTADAVGCPEDLRLAALIQTKIIFDRREEYGVTGRSLEGGSLTMLNILTLPTQVTNWLDPFKVIGAE
jgi:hypothetical protein